MLPRPHEGYAHGWRGEYMEYESIAARSNTSIRRGLLSRLGALVLLSATLPGCLAGDMVGEIAEGESKEAMYFALTVNADAYEIIRWYDYSGPETFSIPRSDLPAGCDTARFFLNDAAHELKIAQRASAVWVTGGRPPLPDDSYPPCALLVSYGSFSEPTALEGVVVTSASEHVATDELKQSHPAAWALMPVGIVADIYIFIGALVTMPVWAPIGLTMENSAAKREQEAKAALPPPIAACWTAVNSTMEKEGLSNPDQPFVGFEWDPSRENAYVLTTADEVFSDDMPVAIDTRVTLRQGRVEFRTEDKRYLWTDADVECGMRTGDVVATCVKLRK